MEPMEKLINGVRTFNSNVFAEKQELFQSFASGQSPYALFITCSDSRINPCELTQTEPGELFILRTAGNIVPPYGAVMGGEAGTIEYAIKGLKIPHIIVCGHYRCGAMTGLLNPDQLTNMPAVQALLAHAESTRQIVNENHPDVTDAADRVALAVETNVAVQLENLRTHPSVAAALARGEVDLNGWTYDFVTGRVSAYEFSEHKFSELTKPPETNVA